jgi:hypothetical protein
MGKNGEKTIRSVIDRTTVSERSRNFRVKQKESKFLSATLQHKSNNPQFLEYVYKSDDEPSTSNAAIQEPTVSFFQLISSIFFIGLNNSKTSN